MGQTQDQPFQLSFNGSLKVDFPGSRVTSEGGLILVRAIRKAHDTKAVPWLHANNELQLSGVEMAPVNGHHGR